MQQGIIKIKKEHLEMVTSIDEEERAFRQEIDVLSTHAYNAHLAFWGFLYKNYDLKDNVSYRYNVEKKQIEEMQNLENNKTIDKKGMIKKYDKYKKDIKHA